MAAANVTVQIDGLDDLRALIERLEAATAELLALKAELE